MVRDEQNRLEWYFKFFTAPAVRAVTMLEMEFEDKVEIKYFGLGPDETSTDIKFKPKGEYSEKIKIKLISPSPMEQMTNLVIIFLAEKEPVFKKVVWKNDANEYPLNESQLKTLNS